MPIASTKVETGDFLFRVLAFGPPKARKTWWAARAAECGFNVIILDGDDGSHIVNPGTISADALKRIGIVQCADVGSKPVFWPVINRFFKRERFALDEVSRDIRLSPQGCNLDHSHVVFDASKLTKNDVLVIDSWTALSASVRLTNAIQMRIELDDGEKVERELYGTDFNVLNWVLQQFKGLSCHLIIIGHEVNWEKRTPDGKTILEQRKQLISSSGNQAKRIPAYMSDVLYFQIVGSDTRILTSADKEREGGCRIIPPGTYFFDNPDVNKRLTFEDMCRRCNVPHPENEIYSSEAIRFFAQNEVVEIPGQVVRTGNTALPSNANGAAKPIAPALPTTTKPTGLSGLLGKSASN